MRRALVLLALATTCAPLPIGERAQATDPALDAALARMAAGQPVTIEMWGDSVTQGFDALTQSWLPYEQSAPGRMQAILRAHYGSSITVANKGRGGNQTTNALRTWAADMAASSADIVTICYGINDALGVSPPGSGVNDPAITADQFAANLSALVAGARAAGRSPVLVSPFATLSHGSLFLATPRSESAIHRMAEATRQTGISTGTRVLDWYGYTSTLKREMAAPSYAPDGIHPSVAVYGMIAEWTAQALDGVP